MGFDFGFKRISAASNEAKFAAIAELIRQWPARCIVGLPSHLDGAEHEMGARCRRFANQLHGCYGIEAILVDERYSSAVLAQRAASASMPKRPPLFCNNIQYFDEARDDPS